MHMYIGIDVVSKYKKCVPIDALSFLCLTRTGEHINSTHDVLYPFTGSLRVTAKPTAVGFEWDLLLPHLEFPLGHYQLGVLPSPRRILGHMPHHGNSHTRRDGLYSYGL